MCQRRLGQAEFITSEDEGGESVSRGFPVENGGRQVSLIDDRTRKWDSLIELVEEVKEGR